MATINLTTLHSPEQEQFNQAFRELSFRCRDGINDIKNNKSDTIGLKISSSNAERFTDLAWQLLGGYIANNSHLEFVNLEGCMINNHMSSLFGGLIKSCSLEQLDMENNAFGIDGVRSMIPFLENSPNLSFIDFSRNAINSECFEVLIRALHGRPVKRLYFERCAIKDLSALERYNLPLLSTLDLKGNNIGREGCVTLSHLLQKDDTRLKFLDLENTGIDDEGAELIASSLENNTKLKDLYLQHNKISERGSRAFFLLLNHPASIEKTYKSNHTLTRLGLPRGTSIFRPIHMNRRYENESSHAAGRAKVIKYHLNSENRKELCNIQGIGYVSIGKLLEDVEPILLPRIISLIGEEHGHNELYTALVSTAPALLSYNVDAKNMSGKKRLGSDM